MSSFRKVALRSPEQARDERDREKDKHPHGETRTTRKVHVLKRRKHPLRVEPQRIAPEKLQVAQLIQIGEMKGDLGKMQELIAQIAELDVTLDVVVEPVEEDTVRFFVDEQEATEHPGEAYRVSRAVARTASRILQWQRDPTER